MAFSGSQKTGLQVYGIPGQTHSFSVKTASAVTPAYRTAAVASEIRTIAVASESRTAAVGSD